MNQTLASVTDFAVPPEVVAFAEEQGVAECLPGFLEVTRRVFPTARRLAVVVEDDPEIANDRHIVIEVDAPLDIPQAMAAHKQWLDLTLSLCPAPLICVFRLSLDLVE